MSTHAVRPLTLLSAVPTLPTQPAHRTERASLALVPAPSRSHTPPMSRMSRLRATLRADLPWLLLSVGTALVAAAATAAWMVRSIHLF